MNSRELATERWRTHTSAAGLTWGMMLDGEAILPTLLRHAHLQGAAMLEIGPGYGRLLRALAGWDSPKSQVQSPKSACSASFASYLGLDISPHWTGELAAEFGHRDFLSLLTSTTAATICQWLTGIDGLVSDPTLYGGGLHETAPGGFLGVHLDNERHPTTGLARRLNLIVYCTDWSAAGGWQDEWGGHLELWDRAAGRVAKRIAPQFNRAVLFETGPHSFHGHTQPLACPSDLTRKSIAVYYWSPLRARARFFARPGETPDVMTEASRLARSGAG